MADCYRFFYLEMLKNKRRIEKHKSSLLFLVMLLLIGSCIPDDFFGGNEKLYFKKIQTPEIKVE